MRARRLAILVPVAAIALANAGAVGQPESGPENQPGAEPSLPSLDELLGITDGGSGDIGNEALERKLSAREAGERFEQAVVLMGDAAGRITDGADLGLQTQRMQEEILRKLDQVIEAAQQNQSGGGSSKSSSGQGQQQEQQTNQSSQGQAAQPGGSEPSDTNMPNASTDVRLNGGVAPDGVTWGNLPERERDAVSQGVNDRYSSLYRRLTELYYRRLAEQEGNE